MVVVVVSATGTTTVLGVFKGSEVPTEIQCILVPGLLADEVGVLRCFLVAAVAASGCLAHISALRSMDVSAQLPCTTSCCDGKTMKVKISASWHGHLLLFDD